MIHDHVSSGSKQSQCAFKFMSQLDTRENASMAQWECHAWMQHAAAGKRFSTLNITTVTDPEQEWVCRHFVWIWGWICSTLGWFITSSASIWSPSSCHQSNFVSIISASWKFCFHHQCIISASVFETLKLATNLLLSGALVSASSVVAFALNFGVTCGVNSVDYLRLSTVSWLVPTRQKRSAANTSPIYLSLNLPSRVSTLVAATTRKVDSGRADSENNSGHGDRSWELHAVRGASRGEAHHFQLSHRRFGYNYRITISTASCLQFAIPLFRSDCRTGDANKRCRLAALFQFSNFVRFGGRGGGRCGVVLWREVLPEPYPRAAGGRDRRGQFSAFWNPNSDSE